MLYIGPVGQAVDSSEVCEEVGDKGDIDDNDIDELIGFKENI